MASRYRWRQQLLGSLQGQLQLATYLVVFLGTPTRFSGHQCPQQDAWGVYGYNDQYYDVLGGACTPRDIWNENKYIFSNPDAWLWDANGFNGYGDHPDY